jgi:hypothetical protein
MRQRHFLGLKDTMKKLLIFTMILTASACAPVFDPDLSGMEEVGTGSATSGDASDSDDTGADTGSEGGSTGTPDMGGSTGDDETGSTGDTGEEGYCGDGILNGDEECDGFEFGDETCETQGYPNGGGLSCDENCTIVAEGSCYPGMCGEQPQAGDYSACQTDQQGGETCGDAALYCVTDAPPDGVCSRACQEHSECELEGYEGCGWQACLYPIGESQGRCFIRCEDDTECPNSMSCDEFPLLNNQKICM